MLRRDRLPSEDDSFDPELAWIVFRRRLRRLLLERSRRQLRQPGQSSVCIEVDRTVVSSSAAESGESHD